ncbi:unnamed protein product [Rotaria sp. Silwood1]|nr:unnamed protein product [Rotaria sp. Silwood1]
MTISKKRHIHGIRILLTVFYGFLLSSILFRYIIHGIVETIRRPTNPYAIIMLVLGTLILISIALTIYATWFDKTTILLASGIVLICVFILTLIFDIVRIINTTPLVSTGVSDILTNGGEISDAVQAGSVSKATVTTDAYALAEDVTKLIIELIGIFFAILATFVLIRYIKVKYAKVPTNEPKAATSS